jgi:hypothetical protein
MEGFMVRFMVRFNGEVGWLLTATLKQYHRVKIGRLLTWGAATLDR